MTNLKTEPASSSEMLVHYVPHQKVSQPTRCNFSFTCLQPKHNLAYLRLSLTSSLYVVNTITVHEDNLTSSDGFSVVKSIVQSANTRLSNTNGRTVFKAIGSTWKLFLYTLRTATCFLTASPSHSDVATELPEINHKATQQKNIVAM